MKILLAPSETKSEGGESIFNCDNLSVRLDRELVISAYEELMNRDNIELLAKVFGLKKEKDIVSQKKKYKEMLAKEAISRYTGVAFDYLEYNSLELKEKEYLNSNLYIFSNLYGVVKPSDLIPNYKLKQGEALGNVKPEKIYKELLKEPLDKELTGHDILDIRAAYYNKLYKPDSFYTTLKFLKNGKVVSHWAKAYRGLVLRYCAINNIKSIKEFIAMPIAELEIKEIIESKTKQEIIYKAI